MTDLNEPDPSRRYQDEATPPIVAASGEADAAAGGRPTEPVPPWYGEPAPSQTTAQPSMSAPPGGQAPSDDPTPWWYQVPPAAVLVPEPPPHVVAPKSRSWKKVAGGVAVAAVVAVGGIAAVTVANASSEVRPEATADAVLAAGPSGQGQVGSGSGIVPDGSGTQAPGGPGREGLRGLAGALHGEFVVPTADGGTQIMRMQRGDVTAISADSLTVTSTDGFKADYVVGDGLDLSSVQVGTKVLVLATVDGDSVTATVVRPGSGLPGGPDSGRRDGAPGEGSQRSPQSGVAPPSAALPPSGAAPSESTQAPQTS